MTSLQELYDTYLRPLRLTWTLDRAAKRRIVVTAALPALVAAAELTSMAIYYGFGPDELYDGTGLGEFWDHLSRAAALIPDILLPLAVGLLFLAGISAWTRAEGSWMLVFGAVLAFVAGCFGLLSTVVYTLTYDFRFLSDIGANLWADAARNFGLLSIGFFFVAYRGLSPVAGEPPAIRVEPPTSDL